MTVARTLSWPPAVDSIIQSRSALALKWQNTCWHLKVQVPFNCEIEGNPYRSNRRIVASVVVDATSRCCRDLAFLGRFPTCWSCVAFKASVGGSGSAMPLRQEDGERPASREWAEREETGNKYDRKPRPARITEIERHLTGEGPRFRKSRSCLPESAALRGRPKYCTQDQIEA